MDNYEYGLKVVAIVLGVALFAHFIIGGINNIIKKTIAKKMWRLVQLDINIGDKFIKKGTEGNKHPAYAIVTWKSDEDIYIEENEYDSESKMYYPVRKDKVSVEELFKAYQKEKTENEQKNLYSASR